MQKTTRLLIKRLDKLCVTRKDLSEDLNINLSSLNNNYNGKNAFSDYRAKQILTYILKIEKQRKYDV